MRINPSLSKRARAYPYIVPLSLMIALFIPGLTQGWYHTDAGLYAALALSAWDAAPNSLFPVTLGGEPYFNKPPIAFWLYGLPMTLFGHEVWVARLVSLIAAAGSALFLVDLTRRLSTRRYALAAGVVLVTTLEFFRYIHTISLDLWLLFFEFAFVWCAVRATFRAQPSMSKTLTWSIAGGLALGCALLVKPFLALICPLLISIWLLVERRPRALVSILISTAIAITVAAPWHIAMIRTYGDAFTNEYFLGQTLNRALSDAHGSAPWFYYFKLIAQASWPWLLALAAALILMFTRRLRPRAARAQRFALIWAGAWFIILSLASDKAGRYLLPFWPAAAILCAVPLVELIPRSRSRIARTLCAWSIPIALAAGIIVALIPGIEFHHPINPKKKAIFDAVVAIQNAAPADAPMPRFWVTPGAHRLRADAFIAIDQWAGIAPDADALAAATTSNLSVPSIGDVLIVRNSTRINPRPSDEIIITNNQFTAVRISSPWDGRFIIDDSAREPID